jgi:hypothetical protein
MLQSDESEDEIREAETAALSTVPAASMPFVPADSLLPAWLATAADPNLTEDLALALLKHAELTPEVL